MSLKEQWAVESMDTGWSMDIDDIEMHLTSALPGDEGFGISHAGGEHEFFKDLAKGICKLTGV